MFQAILLSGGLQHKIMDEISKELDVVSSQLMGLFNRAIRKIVQVFRKKVKTFYKNEFF